MEQTKEKKEIKKEEEIKEMILEYEEALNSYFPKGEDDRRGDALVLWAYGMRVIEQLKS